ncbi:hypothetical protein BUALT_Bualt02G0174300 [Buddleja alternifolia]|uniref:Ubiquitin-like protease family profile domain-containing protein n=1 Tax=Buddleja alternifolia TaxID=168488 RepID=A0AAV6Y848_9LAMI|nr:hypothetical protein BUALT_Bualt02G0174300 [Buddleja alternifolia]
MQISIPSLLKIILKKKKRMKIDPFPITYQRMRTAGKRRTKYGFKVSYSSSSGGCIIVKHHLSVPEERELLDSKSLFSCFSRGPRSKTRIVTSTHMDDGVSAEEIPKESPCPTSSTARPRARQRGRKRKTKAKDDLSDSEVIIPRRTHLRGKARKGQNNSNAIIEERGKLDSATFLHYLMHIWSLFPEEKVKSVAYFDPLWFDLYANENNRTMVLKWIKEMDIFSKKYVLVPIVMWSHWSLLIFCNLGESLHSKTNSPCMLLLDSLHAIGPTRLEVLIRRLLVDVYESEERLENRKQLKKIPLLIPKVPQQNKGEECGFYVLYYISLFLESAPENFNVSEGYPYFMKSDWFSVEGVESFYKRLDTFSVVLSDHDDDSASVDSSDCVELIENFQV